MKRVNRKWTAAWLVLIMSFFAGCQSAAEPAPAPLGQADMTPVASPPIQSESQDQATEAAAEFMLKEDGQASPYQAWLEKNPDFVGWISIEALNISEPVVRGSDNQEYLRKSLEGDYSKAGTVFMDYRNIGNDYDPHRILYGHNLKDDQMFGPLRQYLSLQDPEAAPGILYSSLYQEEAYRVFSVYRVVATDYSYQLTKGDDYVRELVERSALSFEAPPAGAQLLTLSTCSYQETDERLVVHAYRVEAE